MRSVLWGNCGRKQWGGQSRRVLRILGSDDEVGGSGSRGKRRRGVEVKDGERHALLVGGEAVGGKQQWERVLQSWKSASSDKIIYIYYRDWK